MENVSGVPDYSRTENQLTKNFTHDNANKRKITICLIPGDAGNCR